MEKNLLLNIQTASGCGVLRDRDSVYVNSKMDIGDFLKEIGADGMRKAIVRTNDHFFEYCLPNRFSEEVLTRRSFDPDAKYYLVHGFSEEKFKNYKRTSRD